MLLFTEPAIATVEGGNYISPELQCGAVYDGTEEARETTVYQPVYVCVPHKGVVMKTPSTPEIKQHQQSQANNRKSVNTEIEVSESRVSSL